MAWIGPPFQSRIVCPRCATSFRPPRAVSWRWGSADDRLAAWTSDDGRSWRQGEFDLPDTSAYGLVAAPQYCSMAVGNELVVAAVSDQSETRVWTSQGGDVWSFGGQLNISNGLVAASGDRVVIVGYREGGQASAVLRATVR